MEEAVEGPAERLRGHPGLFYGLPEEMWVLARTTGRLERLNRELRRRTRPLGAFALVHGLASESPTAPWPSTTKAQRNHSIPFLPITLDATGDLGPREEISPRLISPPHSPLTAAPSVAPSVPPPPAPRLTFHPTSGTVIAQLGEWSNGKTSDSGSEGSRFESWLPNHHHGGSQGGRLLHE